LTNYITALGYHSYDVRLLIKFWTDPPPKSSTWSGHFTGSNAIYWPMFLMALDLGYRTGLSSMPFDDESREDVEIKGNVVDPFPLIEKLRKRCRRYYLVRETIWGNDGQFTPEQFVERINVDLANDFGNLVNRNPYDIMKKYYEGVIPVYVGSVTPFDQFSYISLAMARSKL
jgi:methionyl-tRNA synthetase